MTRKLWFVVVQWVIILFIAAPAYAQSPIEDSPAVDWRELKTEHFIIVYAERVDGVSIFTCHCGIDEAQFYEGFIDDIYEDLVDVFEVELETPINLRLFPTEESYFQVNPLAEQIKGVVAHALNNRSEIAIALPRTQPLTQEEIINNVRHELTHFFASLLSDGKLTTGFQEGVAQYLEKPTENASYDPTVLQQALDQGRLLKWADLDRAGEVWRDPQVAYPQALSMAAFLVDRYGFPQFVDFIAAHAASPGFRSALEETYGKSADELEAEWLAYLPDYFAGRWQINAIYAYDLTRVTDLVAQGAYTDAEAELEEVIALLETTEQLEELANAEQLLAQANQGRAAGTLAEEARQALTANDYRLTIEAAGEAIVLYEALGYRNRIQELQVYIQRAELGQDALLRLEQGSHLVNSLEFFEAEKQIYDATVMLQSLNNQPGAEHGTAMLARITYLRSLLAYGMLFVGGLLLIANTIRRMFLRYSTGPLEMEYI